MSKKPTDGDPSKRPASKPRPDRVATAEEQAHLDQQLDEALADSFPASDPPSILRRD